jgi:dipeptidyl-peptidase 4
MPHWLLGSCAPALAILCTCLLEDRWLPAQQPVEGWQTLQTIAESSNFTSTATAQEVQQFLLQVVDGWDSASLFALGSSVEQRVIHAVLLEPTKPQANKSQANKSQANKPEASKPEANKAQAESTESEPPNDGENSATLTVLVIGGIHPGECDGKEAILALLRDLRKSGFDDLANLRLIVVPLLNVDGESRRGIEHRSEQAGPFTGVGIRENAQGLDLNRDFIKLETPEVREIVRMINDWDVDVLIDLHTTNGSLHRYDLTYDIPHNPAACQEIDQYLRSDLLPEVTQKLAEDGIPTFYYGNFDSTHTRWETYGHQPRFSTEYMGLRGKVGILVESYSYATYEKRFRASYHFVQQTLLQLAKDAARVQALIESHEAQMRPGSEVPIAAELSQAEGTFTVLGFQTESGQPPSGPFDSESANNLQAKDYSVELWNRAEATQSVPLPQAYAIDAQCAWAVDRLARHGIPVKRLTMDQEVLAEIATITKNQSQRNYQGHPLKKLEVDWKTEKTLLSRDTYVVSATGPLARLTAYLLEPESDESLATWNFFDPYVSQGLTYPVRRLSQLPEQLEQLQEIPRTEELTLEKVMRPGATIELSGKNLIQSVSWLSTSEEMELAYQRDGQWFAMQATTGATRRLTELSELEKKLVELESFSASSARAIVGRLGLWAKDQQRILIRHQGELYLYDRSDRSVRPITASPDKTIELPELSPTGEHIAFVRNNNLWILDCQSGKETQLTDDGSTELLNGILDWVYQEELYGRGNFKGFWWSPDGTQIAWLQLDQTPVPEYLVSDSVSVAQALERTRYPKAGQPIPTARVWVSSIADGSKREVDLSRFPPEDRLVGRVSWSPKGQVWLQVLNRVQNRQEVLQVDPSSGASRAVVSEKTDGWIELRTTPQFLSNGDFLWLSDLPDGRTHLFRVDPATGERFTLTSGDWDVKEYLSVSEDQNLAFVTGNLMSPIESHLIGVNLSQGGFSVIDKQPGSHSVSVHPSGKYYITTVSSLESLPTTIVSSMDQTSRFVVSAPINDRHLSVRNGFPPDARTVRTRDGVELPVLILLPEEASVSDLTGEGGRLPVVFHVYSGPQAPIVRNQWQQRNYWWHRMLCSKGYAVVLCDNRSSQGRGIADTWKVRGDLGRVELQDLEDVAQWVAGQPWADPDRFGIWGWSYGGYMTAYAMANSKLFKAGISGAPVTDWRNYDAIYTERYMDLPSANEAGYKSSSVVEAADQMHGRLMLIHGERDDNVHLSNTLQLAHALQVAGKQFDLMIYPKARHGVVDPKQRYQMHQMMTEFFDRHLK